ncbi:MAG: hypothetical protein ACRDRO_15835 [Pseudonocardiaceae bacterium]
MPVIVAATSAESEDFLNPHIRTFFLSLELLVPRKTLDTSLTWRWITLDTAPAVRATFEYCKPRQHDDVPGTRSCRASALSPGAERLWADNVALRARVAELEAQVAPLPERAAMLA